MERSNIALLLGDLLARLLQTFRHDAGIKLRWSTGAHRVLNFSDDIVIAKSLSDPTCRFCFLTSRLPITAASVAGVSDASNWQQSRPA